MTAPIVDWQSESPDRVPVRVVVYDDADFFESLSDRDRQGFFQVISNSLIQMLNRQARLQFGFPVSVIHGPQAGTECYVEYYITMIRTDFQDGPAVRSCYAATVSAGLRRSYGCGERLPTIDHCESTRPHSGLTTPTLSPSTLLEHDLVDRMVGDFGEARNLRQRPPVKLEWRPEGRVAHIAARRRVRNVGAYVPADVSVGSETLPTTTAVQHPEANTPRALRLAAVEQLVFVEQRKLL